MKKFIIIALCALLPFVVFGQVKQLGIPDNGARVLVYTAASGGNGTTTFCFPELITDGLTSPKYVYDGYFMAVLFDAGASGVAPQVQFREITDADAATGVLTVGTAFTALGAGDIVYLFSSPELQALMGTQGINPWPTGAAPANNVSLTEVIDAIYDTTVTGNTVKLDLIKSYIDTEVAALTDSLEDANDILQSLIGGATLAANPPASMKYLRVNVDYAVAAWQDAATNEVMDFPDGVLIEFWLTITDSTELVCTNATDSTLIQFGSSRIRDVMTGTAGANAHFDVGEMMGWPVPAVFASTTRSVQPDVVAPVPLTGEGLLGCPVAHGFSYGTDIGYALQGAGVSGIMIWEIRYRAVHGNGTVAAGAGGTL